MEAIFMEGIFCGYYDEEMEQDVLSQPNLTEAVSFFRNFVWENKKKESAMKVLIFQIPSADGSSLQISKLDKNNWCVSAKVTNRRRFFGPYFKRDTFEIFIDKSEAETENLICLFYQNTLSEFTELLENNQQ
jgi:hypothetical protein